jgi:diaminohydroxyphosphoribosylaminopyrimidine deaminase/5-amino-6-(5-phosphoribosylamino)uracil reductase
MIDSQDLAYIDMAYGLAEKALGRTCPNPHVGAVVVRGRTIVGFGHHEAAGKPHAEAVALGRAGPRARGATLYLTLEPCVRWGRTPPCVDDVMASGVSRVVVSALDPNPAVHGRGVEILRRAGISVDVGVRPERGPRLNETYTKWITTSQPFVTLKAALSLDGKMATRAFEATWISGPETRAYMHLVRAEHEAILVGARTVLRDDPRLTVRHPNWPGKKIVRVVLDPELRIPPRSRLFRTMEAGPVLIIGNGRASRRTIAGLAGRGAEVVIQRGCGAELDLGRVLETLGGRGVTSVLVEGGGAVAASFLDARLADKVILSFSSRLIGGRDAVAFYAGEGVAALRDALHLSRLSAVRIGDDLVVEGYL